MRLAVEVVGLFKTEIPRLVSPHSGQAKPHPRTPDHHVRTSSRCPRAYSAITAAPP